MKETTDEHGFPRMTLSWHNQNSVIHSEEWLVPPAFGVPTLACPCFIRVDPRLKLLNSFFKQSMSSLGKIIGKSPFYGIYGTALFSFSIPNS